MCCVCQQQLEISGNLNNFVQLIQKLMSCSQSISSHPCLRKLEQLKKKVAQNMQIKDNANAFNKYRIHFEVTQPSNLVGGKLEQHQLEALEWMINLASQQSNGILADDMGLGKTIQAIAYLAYLLEENGVKGKHLIVCPKTVSKNWIREINKWFPQTRVELMQHTQFEREQFWLKVLKPRKFDILVCTYEGVKAMIYKLSHVKWETLIVDEAHKMKNFESQNFQSLNHIKASFKLLLTGTPLNNNLTELWTLLNFIMPDIFHDPLLFQEIEESVAMFEGSEEEQLNFRLQVAKYFHGIIRPYFKRRSKKDLELGLPQKVEKTLYVPLSKLQLQLYKNYLKYGSVYGDGQKGNRNQMIPRKICLHPYLFSDIWPQDKQQFDEDCIESCGKLSVVDKLLQKLLGEGHKVLFFSQFTIFLDLMEEYCEFRSIRYCRLDGSTELEEREQLMDDFNNTDKYQLFMLSTKAGGLGVNLVGADRVIIYDIDWNPQNDIQAMDRAYRIGQKKPVHVFKLITEFTIEERISDLQKYKLIWDELVIQKGGFMSLKKEDPFQDISLQSLENLGKGDIWRLVLDEKEKTIEQILALAEEKNKKKEEEMRRKLKENIDLNIQKINPFQEDDADETVPQTAEEVPLVRRKKYVHQENKREKSKFQRYNPVPHYKFYINQQQIRDLQFEIHMELKKDPQQRNQPLIEYLQKELKAAEESSPFHSWTEDEFQIFLKAHRIYLKADYPNIAELIHSKTPEEVEAYSKHFFQKAPNNVRFQHNLKEIQLGQALIKNKIKQQELIQPGSIMANEESKPESEVSSQLYKSKQEILKEIQLTKKAQHQREKQQAEKIKEQKKIQKEKSNKLKEEKKAEAQRQKEKKAEEQRQKDEKKAEAQHQKEEELRKKKEEQQKKQDELQIKREEKKRKSQAYQKLLEERKLRKEKQAQEKEEKRKRKEEELTKRRQQTERILEEKKTKALEREAKSNLKKMEKTQVFEREGEVIVKKLEVDSMSWMTKSSYQSRATENKEEWFKGSKAKQVDGSSLEIVTANEK